MTCPNCGNNIPGYTKICPTCKFDTEEYTKEYETDDIDNNFAELKKLLSLNEEKRQQQLKQQLEQQLEQQLKQQSQQEIVVYPKEKTPRDKEFDQKDLYTIALGICSIIISCESFLFGIVFAIIGVIFGVVGLIVSINIMKEYNKRCSCTFILSIIGIILSCFMLFGCIVLDSNDGLVGVGKAFFNGSIDKCMSACDDFWSKMD